MRPEKLVAMANQVAVFFRSYPEAEAVAGVHRHLHAFWTPGMVATMQRHMAGGADDADPIVRQAMLHNPKVDSPVEKVLAPMQHEGAMASDAG